ncbi:unnamed protein product [Brassica oleracea]
MSQSSLIRKGGPSNGDRSIQRAEDEIIHIPECDLNYVKDRFRLTLIGPNALGTKLFVDDKKARIQVSIDADKPQQFERRIGFPNGDIGKVTLSYDGLHRYCFTCKLISHDENTCPQLSPEERELKKKQRLESLNPNEQSRLPLQAPYGDNSRNLLKRPRSPPNGRYHSLLESSRHSEFNREEKIRKSMHPSYSTREARVTGLQTRDRKSSSRQDNRYTHQRREVWSRLESPIRKGEAQRGRSSNYYPRSSPRNDKTRSSYNAHTEWRPRRGLEEPRSRINNNAVSRQGVNDRIERSRATVDSQKTITDNRVSLESGEIVVTRGTEAANDIADVNAEEERIRRLKGKAIATATSPPAVVRRYSTLSIRDKAPEKATKSPLTTRQAKRYETPQLEQRENLLALENDIGIDQDLDTPLTDLEISEVENLVLETERLEMAENRLAENRQAASIDENMLDIDNDDLLGDSPDPYAETIEAISQLSPANAVYKKRVSSSQHSTLPKADATLHATAQLTAKQNASGAYVPKGLLKKKIPHSPEIKEQKHQRNFRCSTTVLPQRRRLHRVNA